MQCIRKISNYETIDYLLEQWLFMFFSLFVRTHTMNPLRINLNNKF